MKAYLLVVLYLISCQAFAQSAHEIMRKTIDRDNGDTEFSKLIIATCKYRVANNKINCLGKPRVKMFELARMNLGKDDRDVKTAMVIQSPASDRGIGFLQYDYSAESRNSDQWMYLSAIGKVKRVVSADENEPKTGSLFGSEFNYEDIERRKLGNYSFKLLGEEEYQGIQCWKIESIPVNAYANRSNYSKLVELIDKKRYLSLKMEMHDRSGHLVKILSSGGYERQKGIWFATKLNMNNVQSKRITTLKTSEIVLNVGMKEELLSQRVLVDSAYRETQFSTLRKSVK